MLTAQKENSPLETEALPQRHPTTRSFDKVVNSIEGLRERVQGFTLEQVSEVDQRLRTMSLQLGALQRRLRALAEMKQQMGGLQKAVQQAEAESLEQSSLVTLVEPIALESIAQFGTLLKFRRVIKLLKEAQSGSGALASATAKASAPVLPNPVETTQELLKNEHELGTDLPAIQDELPERSTNEDVVVTSAAPEQTEGVFDPVPAEMDFEPNELFSNEPADAIFLDDSTSIHPREIVAEFADTRDEPPRSHEAIFEEFKGTGDMEVHLAIPETATVDTTGQTHTAASEEAAFDQRLLDDLIKDYGEFTILPSSTPKDEANKKPKHQPTTITPRANASATANPPAQPNLPSPRKDGELDRKLKKLIKDYGEYDLYSRQTPLKLKTGVVAAFLVLTLIFSGFYFFSSPKSTVPVSASSASPSQSSSDTATKQTSPIGETNGEALSTPSVSNVDVPKMVEAGASHNAANKGTAKKTK